MKLNYDCVRNILLYLEENISYANLDMSFEHKAMSFSSLAKELPKYEEQDIAYSIEKLAEAKLIKLSDIRKDAKGHVVIAKVADITWEGHSFLNNIREDPVWKMTKQIAKKIGVNSIYSLKFIAAELVGALITNMANVSDIINNFIK